MRASRAVTLGAVMALAISGCGGSSSPGTANNATVISNAQHAAASEQSIKQAFQRVPGAHLHHGDVHYLAPGEDPSDAEVGADCSVILILASPQAVATYKGDDAVVTNPAGTVGAKVIGEDKYQAACLQEAANVLKGFK